ncbi:MAG: hypothetical protein ABIH72_00965 [archaeon]
MATDSIKANLKRTDSHTEFYENVAEPAKEYFKKHPGDEDLAAYITCITYTRDERGDEELNMVLSVRKSVYASISATSDEHKIDICPNVKIDDKKEHMAKSREAIARLAPGTMEFILQSETLSKEAKSLIDAVYSLLKPSD